jgi:hypothetical protein
MATFDAKKLSRLDWGVAGAGGIALISLFLPWEGATYGIYSASVSGWSTSYGWLGAVLIVAAGVYMVLHRSEVSLSSVPVGPAVVVLGAASLGTLIVILRWLTLPRGGIAGTSFNYGPRIGIILTLLAGIVQVVCAVMLFRASGEVLPWKQTSSAAGGMPLAGPVPGAGNVPTSGFMPQPSESAPPPTYFPPPSDDLAPPSEGPPSTA